MMEEDQVSVCEVEKDVATEERRMFSSALLNA